MLMLPSKHFRLRKRHPFTKHFRLLKLCIPHGISGQRKRNIHTFLML